MRVRPWLFGVSSGLLLAGLTAAACGGTSVDGPAKADSGGAAQDAPIDTMLPPAPDTGADATQDDAGSMCSTDADITTAALPDASLGDGASSIGRCAACVQTTCKTELSACNDNCDCKGALVDFFTCYSGGSPILTCGASLIGLSGDARTLGQKIGLCIDPAFIGLPGDGCKVECAVSSFFGDAGKDSASTDSATDSPVSDAPNDG